MGATDETKTTRSKGGEKAGAGRGGTVAHDESIAASASPGGVDQVREILFGAQREEYDRRFNRLEELLVKNMTALSNEMTEKMGAIRDEYDRRLARLEDLLTQNISDLSQETAKKLEELLKKFNSDAEEIRRAKADKNAVSKLFEEMMKISHHHTSSW